MWVSKLFSSDWTNNENNCHKQRSTLWLGTCPNPPPYKLSHKLKEKSNLINMLMIIVLFFSILWHVITQSVCFEFLMITPLIVICVCNDELYTLCENLHYHLNDFVTQIWLEAVILILSFVFYRGPLRASNLFERTQLPWFSFELHFGLWHLSIPFYCLNIVNVLWAGL